MIAELSELSRRRDKLLFDGRWLSPREVSRHHRRLRWQSFLTLVETVVVLLALLGVAGYFRRLLVWWVG